MKNLFRILIVSVILIANTYAQSERINVYEDTFIQGGETADEAFGETKANLLRVANSEKDNKYARISYLKFKMPKNVDDITKVELYINIKVFKKSKFPEEKFKLSIFGLEDDDWRENNITWEDALDIGSKIGYIEQPQALNDKTTRIKIELDIDELKKIFSRKDRYLSIALASYENKISAVVTSKDSSTKFGPYLRVYE